MDHYLSTTSYFKTSSRRAVHDLPRHPILCINKGPGVVKPTGFLVLGPDYFFGDAVPNHPPDRDREAWIHAARAPAVEAFSKWIDAVKTLYGESPTVPIACVKCDTERLLGTETTKYCAVGKTSTIPTLKNVQY